MLLIYGNDMCVYCSLAKELAEEKNVPYEWRDLDQNKWYNDLKLRMPNADRLTIPQIWWKDTYIGGYAELQVEINKLEKE